MLRPLSRIAVLLGALGSLYCMFRIGTRTPVLLLIMFIGWVLLPFAVLLLLQQAASAWPASRQAALYGVMLLVSVVALVVYGVVVFGPPRAKPAAMFLVVPLLSWLPIAIVWWRSRASKP